MKDPQRANYPKFIRAKKGTITVYETMPDVFYYCRVKKCAVRAQRSLRSLRRTEEVFTSR